MSRVLVVLPTQTYRAADFIKAGEELGLDLIVASEKPPPFEMGDRYLQVDCSNPEAAAESIVRTGETTPIDGIVAADDGGVLVAALAGTELGLLANSPESARAARNKQLQRSRFDQGEVPQPGWKAITPNSDLENLGAELGYPLILKPLDRAAGQGVIKVDSLKQLRASADRVRSIIDDPTATLIAEQYVPGEEVAVEGIIGPNGLVPLAIFDKPDPVEGEGFQETMLITPSRQPDSTQQECFRVASKAARALGLTHGPVHIELMIGEGRVVVIEVAARSIGGLCSQSLRFGLMDTSLESLILRNALGRDKPELKREPGASGVLMIPIPGPGRLEAVSGLGEVENLPGITNIDINARPGDRLAPPPEGDRYLGFVFANAPYPDLVESTLAKARDLIEVTMFDGKGE